MALAHGPHHSAAVSQLITVLGGFLGGFWVGFGWVLVGFWMGFS